MVRERILEVIKDRWNYMFTPFLTMKEFMKYVYAVTVMLDIHDVQQGDVVALYGRRSIRWIGVYIALLLRKATMVIVHPGMINNHSTLVHYFNLSEATIIFSDTDLGEQINIYQCPLVKVIYDIETLLDIQAK